MARSSTSTTSPCAKLSHCSAPLSSCWGPISAEDANRRLEEIVGARSLVAYEQEEEEDLICEVVVGNSLTGKERRGHEVVEAAEGLSFPSQRPGSCSKSLALAELAGGEPMEEGAVVSVPSGDYLLTLWRVDRVDEDEEEEVALREVIVLTPVAEAKVPKRWRPYLSWEQAAGVPRFRMPPSAISDDTFTGHVFAYHSWILSDCSPQVLRKLGVRFGQRLELEVGSLRLSAIYAATLSNTAMLNYFQLHPQLGEAPDLFAGLMYHDSQRRLVLSLEDWSGCGLVADEKPGQLVLRPRGDAFIRRRRWNFWVLRSGRGKASGRAFCLWRRRPSWWI